LFDEDELPGRRDGRRVRDRQLVEVDPAVVEDRDVDVLDAVGRLVGQQVPGEHLLNRRLRPCSAARTASTR
jgi:hypothetical protein